MNKYDARTNRKKRAIVEASLSLFQEKGYAKTTIKDIAASAQVSQVSIYNYYGNKEGLLARCIDVVIEDVIVKAYEILLEDMDYEEKINLALLVCSSEMNHALSNCFSEEVLNDPIFQVLVIKSTNLNKQKIYRKYIEYGKNAGAIDSSLSTNVILEFMDALNSVGSKKHIDENRFNELNQLYHLFLHGLLGKNLE